MYSELYEQQGSMCAADLLAARQASIKASRHYNAYYDNDAFKAATAGAGASWCNRLIDEALAISGDPFYVRTGHFVDLAALRFLVAFERPGALADEVML